MAQIDTLKLLLDTPDVPDAILQFHLDRASDIICELRHSDVVEPQYLNIQIQMAIELFNKMGVEGQVGHSENGVSRTYGTGDISETLLNQIQPYVRTPFSNRRVIT
jgi:hypothetical protein